MKKKDKVDVILTGFDSKEAYVNTAKYLLSISKDKDPGGIRRFLENLPKVLFRNIAEEKAEGVFRRFRALGARLEIERKSGLGPASDAIHSQRENNAAVSKPKIDIPIIKPIDHASSFNLKRVFMLSVFLLLCFALCLYLFEYFSEEEGGWSESEHIYEPQMSSGREPSEHVADIKKEGLRAKASIDPESLDIEAREETGGGTSPGRQGAELYNVGRYEEAIEKFQEALSLAPDSEQVKRGIAQSYLAVASAKLRKKDFGKALENFNLSLKFAETFEGHKGQGIAYMGLGDKESAIESFESSLALNAKDAYVQMAAGILSYEKNNLKAARSHFEKVLKFDPGNSQAAEYLQKIKREGIEEHFRNKDSFHFTVKYEGAERGDAGYLVSMVLEEAYNKVGSDLGFYPEDIITAILYTDRQFRDVTRSPAWAGGLYDGKIRLPVGGINERTEDLERVVYHEYTHALVHRMTGGNCPVWLNEGLAQYEEVHSSVETAKNRVRSAGALMPLRFLERSFTGMNASTASIAYATSILAVDYLIREYGILYVKRLLEKLKEETDTQNALYSVFYIQYDEIENGLKRSVEY